ncbi:MAG TPA: hypothetical protein VL359_20360 [bacterium]|nr:hypothetical protein [bacterium]
MILFRRRLLGGSAQGSACASPVRWSLPLLALAVLASLGACSSFRDLYPRLDGLAAQGQYRQAAKLVEKYKDDYGDRNAVLYNLDRGTFYHYAGQYAESNKAFQLAEDRMDELFTQSITQNVAAFAVNDNLLPYRGEDFESVIVDIFQALNYVSLGNVENALVKARKVDEKLNYINSQYEPNARNVYKADGFARMLMGALYETGGSRSDLNDAFISYRLAVGIYQNDFFTNYGVPVPAVLQANYVTTAQFMGSEEFQAAQSQFGATPLLSLDQLQAQGQLYFVHYDGRAPVKVESSINAVVAGNLLRIAFPEYRRRYYLITGSRVLVDGQLATTLDDGDPVGQIAIKNLDNRKGRIAAKAIARATTKFLANLAVQREAEKRGGQVAGLLAWAAGNAATAVSEQADLRSWQTLPDRILIGRVVVPAGKHRVQVQLTTGAGAVVATRDLGEVEVRPGSTRFFLYQSNT